MAESISISARVRASVRARIIIGFGQEGFVSSGWKESVPVVVVVVVVVAVAAFVVVVPRGRVKVTVSISASVRVTLTLALNRIIMPTLSLTQICECVSERVCVLGEKLG